MMKRPLAIGLQEQVANHRKRLGSKTLVVSVMEKVSEKMSGMNQGRAPFPCLKKSGKAEKTAKYLYVTGSNILSYLDERLDLP